MPKRGSRSIHGIAIQSEWDVEEEVATGHLLPISLGARQLDALANWAVYPTARLVLPKVRLFIATLEVRLGRAHNER
jgi:DNA-binding transcriptional LysR family regulator